MSIARWQDWYNSLRVTISSIDAMRQKHWPKSNRNESRTRTCERKWREPSGTWRSTIPSRNSSVDSGFGEASTAYRYWFKSWNNPGRPAFRKVCAAFSVKRAILAQHKPWLGKSAIFFVAGKTQTALRTMGTVAEAPLLTVAPAADADVALAAVALLAECGTEASYPLLRKAMRSRNPQVRETAKQSLARIRDRVASGAPLVVARENPNSPFAAPSETSASDAILKADQGGAASAASGPGREQGDWSDVQIIMRSHSLAARGLPADPAFPSAGTIQLKPIVLNVRQDGLLDFFPQQMLAHLSGARSGNSVWDMPSVLWPLWLIPPRTVR